MAPGCCWHSFPGIPPGSGERKHACLRRVHGRTEGKGDTTQRCVFYLSSTFHLLSILPVCPQPKRESIVALAPSERAAIRTKSATDQQPPGLGP